MDSLNSIKNEASAVLQKQINQGDEILEFSEHGDFNVGLFLVWVAAALAILGTVFFWLINRSLEQNLADKTAQRQDVVSQITSPTYADVEKKATAFKASVLELQKVVQNRYVMADFLPLFYAEINKNIVVKNAAVSSALKLSFDGSADSYRAVAEQAEVLKSWKINDKNVLKNVDIASSSEKVDSSGKPQVTFSVTALIDKTVPLKEVSAGRTSSSSSTDVNSQGGDNAQAE